MAPEEPTGSIVELASRVESLADLAHVLRDLRRRDARARGGQELVYREIATQTGWSVSAISSYLTGTVLPSTDRFDALVRLFGGSPGEQRVLATARDRIEEKRDVDHTGGRAPVAIVPRELPAGRRGFVGRVEQQAELDAILAAAGDESGEALPVVAVTGTAGVGKTALVVHWAHRVADQFPDGQLYVDLRGFDPDDRLDATDALGSLLRSLGMGQTQEALGLAERAALFRSVLADRRVLVVLDNAGDAEQVRPLLPGSRHCMVVVTSRDSLVGLVATEGAYRVHLDGLEGGEATTLLRGLIGVRVDEAPDAVQALIRYCGGLPLAMCLAADVALQRAVAPLAELIDELANEQTRLDVFETGEVRTGVRSVLSWSYHGLSDNGRRLFRLLGSAPGPTLTLPAVANLAGIGVADARRLLTQLTRACMVTEIPTGRYGFHDLLRAYAAERAKHEDDDESCAAAARRLLDFYVAMAVRASGLLYPNRRPLDVIAPAQPPTLVSLDSDDDALRWFTEERASLLAAVHWAVDHDNPDHARQLLSALSSFLDRSGHWQELATLNARVLEVSTSQVAKADAHRGLALAAGRLELFHTAVDHYQQAALILEQVGDHERLARVYMSMNVLGNVLTYATVADYQRKALALFRLVDDPFGQVATSNNLAMCLLRMGDYPAALAAGQDALESAQQLDDWDLTASTLDTIAEIQLELGQPVEAIRSCEMALSVFRESGHRMMEAEILTHCGDAYAQIDDRAAAEGMWNRALAIYDELHHPDANAIRVRLIPVNASHHL